MYIEITYASTDYVHAMSVHRIRTISRKATFLIQLDVNYDVNIQAAKRVIAVR